MHRIPGRILLITAAFALLLVPVAAIAAGGFDDVADDNVFKADIQWLADAGVTKGCNPPTNTEFCPSDYVTREQMAAFMHRLAVNKVVDAKSAMTATNADKLDGKDSTAFATSGHNHDAAYLAIAGKAADADKLDGVDSDSFLPDGTPPVGTTARGTYALGSEAGTSRVSIRWGFEMPSSPTVHLIRPGEDPSRACPGTYADPQAARGHLCVYETYPFNVAQIGVMSAVTGAGNTAEPYGAIIWATNSSNTGTTDFSSYGTWAITVGTS